MANISLQDPNFVYVNNYFYTIDDSLQVLIKKTFDGTIAFCYTLNIPVASQVLSLDYDGVNFWSLEKGSSRVVIRKWKILDLMCVQQAKFEIIGTVSEIVDGDTFAIEHYSTKFSGPEGTGQTVLSVSDTSNIANDLRIVIGPNSLGQSEEKFVDSFNPSTVTVKTPLVYTYSTSDPINFYKSGYYFNNYDGTDSTIGSLYKVDLESGSVLSRVGGTQFKDVKSAVFGEVKNKDGDAVYDFNNDGNIDSDDIVKNVMFIKGNLMMFVDLDSSSHDIYGSMVMDLISGSSTETVYDLTLNGSTIYMLKSGYDYEVAQFDRMVNSISVTATPAILPADSTSTSAIRASVLDQYNKFFISKNVYFTLAGNNGAISADSAQTNTEGIATINYIAGDSVADVTITATVHQS